MGTTKPSAKEDLYVTVAFILKLAASSAHASPVPNAITVYITTDPQLFSIVKNTRFLISIPSKPHFRNKVVFLGIKTKVVVRKAVQR